MDSPPTLETDRLVLRPFEAGDAESAQRLAGDWRIADTTNSIPHPYPDGLADTWISGHKENWETGTSLTYAIIFKKDTSLIGAVSLVEIHANEAELGYWVGVPYWNQGYCTEAVNALIEFSFSSLSINRVDARHLTRNPASGRVLLKAGLLHVGNAYEEAWKGEDRVEVELYERFST
jgi:ribosomal-protein-alanine N-acetyltransferase